jgi:hypothetical protein
MMRSYFHRGGAERAETAQRKKQTLRSLGVLCASAVRDLKFGYSQKLRQVSLISLLLLSFSANAYAQKVVLDQILTIVNGEIITRSDLLWSIALIPESPDPAGPISNDLLQSKLEVMVDELLIAQEAARVQVSEVSAEEINKKRAELIALFPSEAIFRKRLESVGLTSDKLDDLLRQRVLIDKFVEFRFRSFVFVSETDIQKYYDEQLAPEVRKAGLVPPPIEQVRDKIQQLLAEQKVEQETNRWLTDARQRADVVHLAEP